MTEAVLKDYRCVSRFRTAFHDFDYLQHANNIAYITWTETLRCEYMHDVLLTAIDGEQGWIMAKQSFDYLAQINYLERVAVGARISRIGMKSLEMIYEIWNEATGVLSARGTSTLVAYDFSRNTSIAVPDTWRERIRAFEATAPIEAAQTAS